MFGSIFDPENSFWRTVGKTADVLALSVLWLLCSLPLVTLGSATAALYDASARGIRGGESAPWRRFLRCFKRELGVGIPVTVLGGLLLFSMGWILRLLWAAAQGGAPGGRLFAAAYFIMVLIPAGAFCWAFPLLSRFSFRPLGLMATALKLSVWKLHYTLLILIVLTLAYLICAALVLPLLFIPCLTALLWSVMMERVFIRYMPQEEDGSQD